MQPGDAMVISLEILIALLSIFGNSLVVIAVYRIRALRTVTNIFIVSLAFADLLVGVVAIPFAIASSAGQPTNSFYGCLFVNCAVIVLTQSSIFSLLAIGIERWAAICHPFAYQRWNTTPTVVTIIAGTWFAAAFIGLIPLMGWSHKPDDNTTCQFVKVIDMTYMVYFNFFGCVLPPLIILLIIYIYIFYIVWKQSQRIASLEISDKSKKTTVSKNLKAAKSLSSVVGLFILCWLPIHILNSMTVLCPVACRYPHALLQSAILLSHANSAVNPAIYAMSNSGFRRAFRLILRARMEQEQVMVSATVLGETGSRVKRDSASPNVN